MVFKWFVYDFAFKHSQYTDICRDRDTHNNNISFHDLITGNNNDTFEENNHVQNLDVTEGKQFIRFET